MYNKTTDETLESYDTKRSRKYKPTMQSESNIERGLNKYRNLPSLK